MEKDKFTWGQPEADARFLFESDLPTEFWAELDAVVTGKLLSKKGQPFSVNGQLLTFARSYAVVTSDQRRVASLPMRTLRLAHDMHESALAKAKAEEDAKADAERIVWEEG